MRNIIIWISVISVLSLLLNSFIEPDSNDTIDYSQFIEEVNNGAIDEVTFEGDGYRLTGTRKDDTKFETNRPINVYDDQLVSDLIRNNVTIIGDEPKEQSILEQLIISIVPLVLFALLFLLILRYSANSMGGGRGGPLSFASNKAKILEGGKVDTTFNDVAGCEEAKEEVREIVAFLRDPKRFESVGGRIPRGILLVGPPGTGKTLLARAIAGEAGVNFFSTSGSDFVEMFVGVGASRVRSMFANARQKSPCIIFIDEIDAVGRHRGAGLGGGHDEREQTLNQLLVEMDGFEVSSNVIVMAATNRPDVLDPALLRPGRFDRQVTVDLPDIKGREAILKVHSRSSPLDESTNLLDVARGTPGFSGADLANLVNEAALIAAKLGKVKITGKMMDAARDKIMMGTERKSMVMSQEERKLTAYHESGHAIIGHLLGDHDPVYKISIIPRGRALGVTIFLPEEDKHSYTKKSLISRITSLFGGRMAEELIFGEENITTGASNDIEKATELARNMVTKWGLSPLGPIHFEDESTDPFLGRRAAQNSKTMSTTTAEQIEKETSTILNDSYEAARAILKENMDKLHKMAALLIEVETLDKGQIEDLMDGLPVRDTAGGTEQDDDDSAASNKDKSEQAESKKPKGSPSGDGNPPVPSPQS